MKKRIICVLMCTSMMIHATKTWIEEDQYTVKYSDEPPVICFKQKSGIVNNNNQNVTCNHPITQPIQPELEQPSMFETINAPVLTWLPAWVPFKQFLTPVTLSAGGLAVGILAYTKTKFTLYNLSKACVQTAFWSLWKSKKPHDMMMDEQGQDIALLYDIINTYRTDQHAMAISLFLQDVDKELDILKEYIQEASQAQSSFMRFMLPDMSKDIVEAEARLAKLTYLKQKILSWLAYEKLGYADKQRINGAA